MKTLIVILQVLVSLGLIATVLLQSGKSAGISGAIGGAAQSFFGKKKGLDELFNKITVGLAAAFIVLTLLLSIV